ncbi:MAG TPA: tetratricopeptide repeat protein [Rudaea sp.]|jgi:TolB-like protein/Flp pilus assembly protein TadD|uniref:TPR end-of-group domain-containing protein n=1 Tax=Rudaea sp. TaxID=2136325 RepID=UPI002F9277F8
MSDFLQRLRERKLVQWALAYAAAAFALIQVLDIVAQRFGWPESIERFAIVSMAIGFFVTLVLAWYHGERGAQRVTGTELLILALLLTIGGAVTWRLAPTATEPSTTSTTGSKQSSVPEVPVSDKSIAVLPFENLSDDKANAYFAEGIQDEVLTRLSKISALKVISRTSTQQFGARPGNLSEIARQLGVANILEGSVQKANDQVRVNVQLINARTDTHLWADIYDRKLTDIFTVESDIAKTISEALQAKLTGSEQLALAVRPTENSEAYQFYLQGRFFWNKRIAVNLRKSIDFFAKAIEKDPNYALAYAMTAQAWLLLPSYGGCAPKDCLPQAQTAAKKALELDPNSADAHAALGMVKYIYEVDMPGSAAELERAIALDPNNATAHHWLGNHPLAALGQIERETVELKRALELDPLSMIINTNLAQAYIYARRYDTAIAQLRRTIEMDASFYFAHYMLGIALELAGSPAEAEAEYRASIASGGGDPFPVGLLGHLYAKTGRPDEARKILDRLLSMRKDRYVEAYTIAMVYLGLGDRTEALNWLEQGYRERDGADIAPIRVDPMLDPLHGDPRFEALAEKIVPARDFTAAPAAAK